MTVGARLLRWLCWAVSLLAMAETAGAQTGLVIEDVDIVERAGYVDVNLIFACALRYTAHQPSSQGELLRIRTTPQRDCELPSGGLTAPTLSPTARSFIATLELDRPISTEIDIAIAWRKSQRFLVLPSGDSRGVRIRLLTAERSGRVSVGADLRGQSLPYAVNLESSHEPIPTAAVTEAAQLTGAKAYVSEYLLDQEKWYRLRIGPFATEADGKRALLAVRARFPKAWLAIADDAQLTSTDARDPTAVTVSATQPAQATLTALDIERVMTLAKSAFRKKDYDTAIPLFTQLLEHPEFPARAEALELMGLARERHRQLAHAKAEYEEYLRRYPNGPGVERVRQRLQALALAARKSIRGMASAADDESPWKIYGGASQLYRRDDTSVQTDNLRSDQLTQNALLTDIALVAKRRGERFDFNSRLSAGYAKSFLDNGLGDQTRVSTAFVELSDRVMQWRARLGRQSAAGIGVLGVFDGVYGDYQVSPRTRIAVSAGAPVLSTRESFDSDRRMMGVAAHFGPFAGAWDVSTFALTQTFQGETDRRALGTEVHYYQPGRTFVSLIDYDLHYRELNTVLLLGTLALPARWTLSVNAERRQSPMLGIGNALIGQAAQSLDELLLTLTRQELESLARDRTAVSDLYSASLSRPVGERWLWTFDIASVAMGGTPASAGVPAVPESPRELIYSALAVGNSVFTSGDVDVLALRYQASDAGSTASLGLSTRWPLWNDWRVTPRVRADRRELLNTQTEQWLYAPSLRIEYQRGRMWFELEGGVELSESDTNSLAVTQSQKTSRTFFSAGYRLSF